MSIGGGRSQEQARSRGAPFNHLLGGQLRRCGIVQRHPAPNAPPLDIGSFTRWKNARDFLISAATDSTRIDLDSLVYDVEDDLAPNLNTRSPPRNSHFAQGK